MDLTPYCCQAHLACRHLTTAAVAYLLMTPVAVAYSNDVERVQVVVLEVRLSLARLRENLL